MKLKACLLAIALCCSSTAFAGKTPISTETKPIDITINAPVEVVTAYIQRKIALKGTYILKNASNGVLVYETPSEPITSKVAFVSMFVMAGNNVASYRVLDRVTWNIIAGESPGTTILICLYQKVYNPGTPSELVYGTTIGSPWYAEVAQSMDKIRHEIEGTPVNTPTPGKIAYKYFNEDGTLKTPANP